MNRLNKFGSTKIICTIGPASQNVDALVALIEAGMDVARLNFSHGSYEQHLKVIENVREASRKTGEYITILQDLSGPKIRTGTLKNGSVELTTGSTYTFTVEEIVGDERRVSTTYRLLPNDVQPGDTILVDDGKIKFSVISTTRTEVLCTVFNGGILSNKKGMNLPGVKISVPSHTEKDIEDLMFGLKNDVDYVALSFVRSAEDIRKLREIIIQEVQKGKRVPIVAKIEKPEAVEDIDKIIRESDVIMVARGDLGVELPPEEVPIIQKMIVRKCNDAGVPVIIATQMLESMIENPRPTRAEANDVANAVLDGTDAVMLSAETSVGKYPVAAVHMMDQIIRRAEVQGKDHLEIKDFPHDQEEKVFDAIGRAACVMAKQIGATAIIPLTHSGATAMNISKYRPQSHIIAITGREKILRRLNIVWGVRGIIIPDFEASADVVFKKIKDELKTRGYVQNGDYVVFTAGIPLMSKGSTNTIKVEKVE
ncbi:MAG: pyruvate kinase [Ignavibacteriales bacterium]|nr:pyruvate kinase [Ignavibacteriales bacterium]